MAILTLAKQVNLSAYLLWVGVFLVVVIGASLAVLWYRRRVLNPPNSEVQAGLMDELRAMRKRGELSEEEFTAAKQAMVSRISGQLGTPAPPRKPRPGERVAPPGVDLTGQPLPKPAPPPEQ